MYTIGIDLGGTTVKLGLFEETGAVLEKWEIPTYTENGGEKILPDVAVSIKEKMRECDIEKEEVVGVGVGVDTGILHITPAGSKAVIHIAKGFSAVSEEETEVAVLKRYHSGFAAPDV